ncbi:CBN-TAG-218 protein [Caenorhabditis brenneri]|uniref:CBN-TAG-218 protein n=1 Tax=Caenorhabditis brenneri TaxID=135651 RepID=G0NBZ4_CAEBE|nr:CBN-TAG-218 protein [Caenorhabditis brenneri]
MRLPNVRELAKRFETGARIEVHHRPVTAKRIGKFRVIESSFQLSTSSGSTPSSTTRVIRGSAIPRRKSSLKRRTRSNSELTVTTSSTDFRKSKSTDDFSPGAVRETLVPLPAPRLRLQTTNMTDTPQKDTIPVYEERLRVSLTIPIEGSSSVSPPPPLPSAPPSRERIKRIPSYLKPTPAPRSMSSTLPRARLKTPPPPPPPGVPSGAFDTLPVNFRESGSSRTSGFPRIPSIPVPDVPGPAPRDTPASQDTPDNDDYDEILLVTPHESSMSYQPTHHKEYFYESTDFTRGPSRPAPFERSDTVPTPRRQRQESEEVFDEAEEEVVVPPRVKFSTLQRNPKSSSKRLSTMELDKLFRFKSELQLNLSKKVGQLRQKVGEKQAKRRSKCHVSVDLLDTDCSGTMSKSMCLEKSSYQDDDHIYGDDWSSDDDDIYHDDRRSSMYRQLEEQLNKAFPEYTSGSQLSSDYESADVLLLDQPIPAPPNRPMSSTTLPTEEKYTARPAVGHLPLDESWQPPSLEDGGGIHDEPSPDEEEYKRQYTCRMVPNEQPLYQHYMMEAVGGAGSSGGVEEEDSGAKIAMEEIKEEPMMVPVVIPEVTALKPATRRESSISSDSGRGADCSTTSASALTSNTSMRRDRLVGTSNFGSQRSLWCELPEVRAAGLLEKLDDACKLRQEAYFEVITSEASYLRSLNVLITHFMASPQMLGSKSALSVLSDSDRKHLFSNIFAVRDCSERLLCDLETRLEENLILDDICDILSLHFEKHFEVYIKYCSNQVYQDRTLRRLKSENPGFLSAVQRLEENKQCQGLDMRSFLMLPMQRITRYPLLLYAILDRIPTSDDRYKTATSALTSSNRVVRDCNEGARRMERTEQLLDIDRRLVYKDADLKRIPLVSNSRYLVKKGVLTQLVERRSSNILQSRQKARTLHVFLFSDMIMITKKKLNGTFVCKDYASRRFVDMQPIEPDNPKIPLGAVSSLVGRPHLFLCTLMRNAREKQTELLLSADSETDRERWLSAVRPPTSTNPEEKIYAEWDCPQAVVVHAYQPSQADELQLNIGDSLNILRKMPDGWLYGERATDGLGGWFPSSYVQPIINDHTRANNYRQRLRIIQAAAGWHGNASPSSTRSGGMPLMDRLRRMSNPKSYFQSGTVGL